MDLSCGSAFWSPAPAVKNMSIDPEQVTVAVAFILAAIILWAWFVRR